MKHNARRREKKTCRRCKGKGYVPISNSDSEMVCQTCKGKGKLAIGVRPNQVR